MAGQLTSVGVIISSNSWFYVVPFIPLDSGVLCGFHAVSGTQECEKTIGAMPGTQECK